MQEGFSCESFSEFGESLHSGEEISKLAAKKIIVVQEKQNPPGGLEPKSESENPSE